MYSNLINHINKHIDLDDDSIEVMNRFIKPEIHGKKKYLLKEGQICRSIFFVEKGCLRMYFVNDKRSEQITQFALEHWWISDFASFMGNKPSEYFIQTVEESVILTIDLNSFEEMLRELPQMERYFRMIMEREWASSQQRIKYMYSLSKEEFYNHFCRSFPEFVQRVPQYMIASYLGLTPEYVSELRKKKLP